MTPRFFFQLKELYNLVTSIKVSGLPWSDVKGFNVTVESEETFNTFVKVCFSLFHPTCMLITHSVKRKSGSIQGGWISLL